MLKSSIFSVALLCAAYPCLGQAPANADDPVLKHYSERYGVTIEEAARRNAKLAEIARVNAELERRFPRQYSGMYVVNEGDFKIMVRMTGAGQGLLRQITDDLEFVVEQSETPLQQLNALQQRVADRLSEAGVRSVVGIRVEDGVVEVQAEKPELIAATLGTGLAGNKNLRISMEPYVVENAATIYGGQNLAGSTQNCTAGFVVTSSVGDGIITTGHCDPTMTLSGVIFRNVSRVYANSSSYGFDLQFMRPSTT